MMNDERSKSGTAALLTTAPRVANIGLARFAEDLSATGAAVVHVAWTPPAGGNVKLGRLLAKLGS